MVPAFVLKIVLFAVALLLLILFVRSLFTRRRAVVATPRRLRLPPLPVTVAIVLLALGFVLGMLGFGSGDTRDPVPFRIGSVVAVAAGLVVLLVHRRRTQRGRDR